MYLLLYDIPGKGKHCRDRKEKQWGHQVLGTEGGTDYKETWGTFWGQWNQNLILALASGLFIFAKIHSHISEQGGF